MPTLGHKSYIIIRLVTY